LEKPPSGGFFWFIAHLREFRPVGRRKSDAKNRNQPALNASGEVAGSGPVEARIADLIQGLQVFRL